MPAAIQPKPKADDLFAQLERLDPVEADQVAQRLLQLQARRRAPSVSAREAELLEQVYRPKRAGFQERFDALNNRLRSQELTEDEHAELLRLIDESELYTADRLRALAELAQLRGVPVNHLMKQLGLKAPPVA